MGSLERGKIEQREVRRSADWEHFSLAKGVEFNASKGEVYSAELSKGKGWS